MKERIGKLKRRAAWLAREAKENLAYTFRQGWTFENKTAVVVFGVIVVVVIGIFAVLHSPEPSPESVEQGLQAKSHHSTEVVRIPAKAPVSVPTPAPTPVPVPAPIAKPVSPPLAEVAKVPQAPKPQKPTFEELPSVSSETCSPKRYRVVEGDQLGQLAIDMYEGAGFWHMVYIAEFNKIKNPNHIYVGQEILLPTCIDGMPPMKELAKKYAPFMAASDGAEISDSEATPVFAIGEVRQDSNIRVERIPFFVADPFLTTESSRLSADLTAVAEFGRCVFAPGLVLSRTAKTDLTAAALTGTQ